MFYTAQDFPFMYVCVFLWMFLRQPISLIVVPRRCTLVIPLPQSRDGRLWASAKASVASTKLCSVFHSQGPLELHPGLSAPCLCPV